MSAADITSNRQRSAPFKGIANAETSDVEPAHEAGGAPLYSPVEPAPHSNSDPFIAAFDEGSAARLSGVPRSANPHAPNTLQRRGWFSGHEDRDAEMARKLERAVVAEGAVRA